MKRYAIVLSVAALLLVGAITAALTVRCFRTALDRTTSLADWAVAFGTFFLALATFELGRRAREEGEAVRVESEKVGEQVALQKEQMEAATRAYVYPYAPQDWATGTDYWDGRSNNTLLPLMNGGPGLALNARGRVFWNPSSGSWPSIEFFASSIAPNTHLEARLAEEADEGWVGAFGYVRYSDLRNQHWVTYFRFEYGAGDQLVLEHQPPRPLAEAENPDLLNPADVAARSRS